MREIGTLSLINTLYRDIMMPMPVRHSHRINLARGLFLFPLAMAGAQPLDWKEDAWHPTNPPGKVQSNREDLNALLDRSERMLRNDSHRGATVSSLPKGWWAGRTDEYRIGVDDSNSGKPAAFIEALVPAPKTFIALNQTFSARDYRGKRVRFAGSIKTDNVRKWAGFWLRADNEKSDLVAFDNMQSRGVSGTSDWKRGEIVLDIPGDAEVLFLGLILDGAGKAWTRDLVFEIVDSSVPVTTSGKVGLPKSPQNLDFSEK